MRKDTETRFTLVIALVVSLAVGVAACRATSSSPISSSGPTSTAVDADLAFSFDFPSGWVVGRAQDRDSILTKLKESNPEYARKLEEIVRLSPTVVNEFVAYNLGSPEEVTPLVSCNTLDRDGVSIAATLAQGEKQNVAALARMPGIVGEPVADRMTLPVGTTVRVRWRVKAPGSAGELDLSSIGYLFVQGQFVYTCVFSASTSTIASHEREWEAILESFHANGSASPAASEPQSVVDTHDASEVEALLPEMVAGRRLVIWSVRGDSTLKLWGLTDEEITAVDKEVASMGAEIHDLVQATAGRADAATDPPYFIFAFRFPAGAEDLFLDHALEAAGIGAMEDGDLAEKVVGGKRVAVATKDLIFQDEHERGKPYIYEKDGIAFIVVTDDAGWAEDAIRQLP